MHVFLNNWEIEMYDIQSNTGKQPTTRSKN
jgi:hypothetical protein